MAHARSLTSAAIFSALLIAVPVAHAHFVLVEPPGIYISENGGKGAGPCGEGNTSDVVTEAKGGSMLQVKLKEYIPHPGHDHIALSVNSRDDFTLDPESTWGPNERVTGTVIEKEPQPPMLADGLFAHTSVPRLTDWATQVKLPNLSCPKCTLQVLEFMNNAPRTSVPFYRHCADLNITMDPSRPPADKIWMSLPKNDSPKPAGRGAAAAAATPAAPATQAGR